MININMNILRNLCSLVSSSLVTTISHAEAFVIIWSFYNKIIRLFDVLPFFYFELRKTIGWMDFLFWRLKSHDCKHNVDKQRLIGGFSILGVILVEMVFG
jgi:hypothetical protein